MRRMYPTLQSRLGPNDVSTTMIYTHVLNPGRPRRAESAGSPVRASVGVFRDEYRRVGNVTGLAE